MEVSGQLHPPTALIPGKEPRDPLGGRLGGPQSRSGRGGEEKNTCSENTHLWWDFKTWTHVKRNE